MGQEVQVNGSSLILYGQGLQEMGDGFRIPPLFLKQETQLKMGRAVFRLVLDRLPKMVLRILYAPFLANTAARR